MNRRIAYCTLLLLSLAACGQAGKLVLPEKNVPPPKATEVKPAVVAPITNDAPDTTTAPAPTAPEDTKKEQP